MFMKKVCFAITLGFIFIIANFITIMFYLNPINLKGEVYDIVTEVEDSVYNNYGKYDVKLNNKISKSDFNVLNYRDNYNDIAYEKHSGKVSKIFKRNNKAIVEYNGSYSSYYKNNELYTYSDIIHLFYLVKINNDWIVKYVDTYDIPVNMYQLSCDYLNQ